MSRGLPSSTAMAQDLASFLAMQGRLILDDRARLLLKLREAWPDRIRAINLLMTAFDFSAVHHLAASGAASDPLTMEQTAQSIADETGTQIDLARWALDVWQKTLAPVATPPAATPPAAPVNLEAAAQHADDMTWGDEPAPIAPNATAPAAVTPASAAPSAVSPVQTQSTASAAPASIMPPPPIAAPARKQSAFLWVVLTAVVLVIGAGALYAVGILQLPDQFRLAGAKPDDKPEPPKPVTQSSQVLVAPGQLVTAAQVKEAQTDIIVDGFRNNKEPTFPSAFKVESGQEHWQFQFNVKDTTGKRFAYHVNLFGRNDTGDSKGLVTAIDRSLSDDKLLSVSNVMKIENKPNKISFGHLAWGLTWAKNPSGVPAVCVSLYSNNDAESSVHYPAVFFVSAFVDGSCGAGLGSGTLQ